MTGFSTKARALSKLLALLLLAGVLPQQGFCAEQGGSEKDGEQSQQQRDARMKWWRQARFGMFVHWGPVSLKGTEIGWSRGGERRGRSGRGSIPAEVYDNLYKQFNPVKFDAHEWVQIAKDAGMKYLVFTTKHHDGFVNFDSKLTDNKITSPESPFRRDIVAELAEACHKAGIKLGFYYSPPDWHHPDYRTANHARYVEYLHGQLRELCTNYGKVDVIWFDGLGGKPQDWDAENLVKMIRQLQPNVIINNRCGLPEDYDTPEQRIGTFDNRRDWETCMTICRQWAWKPDDDMKSLKQCVQTLVRVAGGDGNFLFNVGPMPDGRIEPRQVERLREMGKWLKQYGRSVYATRGGPLKPGAWGASTRCCNFIYLHVLNWPGQSLSLPPIDKKIVRSRLLTGGNVEVKQTPDEIIVTVAEAHRQEIDTIVVLELDGPAGDIPPVSTAPRSGSLAFEKKAAASNVYRRMVTVYGPAKATDDDPETRWATDVGTAEAWLEVDLGKPCTISRAVIREAYAERVQQFELQGKQGDRWQTFYKGSKLGEHAALKFEPVTFRQVRLHILKSTEGPTIWEFQLFAPKQ